MVNISVCLEMHRKYLAIFKPNRNSGYLREVEFGEREQGYLTL